MYYFLMIKQIKFLNIVRIFSKTGFGIITQRQINFLEFKISNI